MKNKRSAKLRNKRPPALPSLFPTASRLLLLLWAGPVCACSIVNEAAASAESVAISNYYLLATALLGVICLFLAFYRQRLAASMVAVTAVLIFHPSRTIAPVHGSDCSYLNIEISQLVLASMVCLLVYHLWRIAAAKRLSRLDD